MYNVHDVSTIKLTGLWPQPLVGAILGFISLLALATSFVAGPSAGIDSRGLLLGLFLTGAVAAAYQFPIHAGHRLKVEMTTVPLYLMAVLLPFTPLAAACAGLGVLGGELLLRKSRGNYISDTITASA